MESFIHCMAMILHLYISGALINIHVFIVLDRFLLSFCPSFPRPQQIRVLVFDDQRLIIADMYCSYFKYFPFQQLSK